MHFSTSRLSRLVSSAAVVLLLPGCSDSDSDSEADADRIASARIDDFVESAEGALRDVDYGLQVSYVTEQVNATLAAVAARHDVDVRLLKLQVRPIRPAEGMIEAIATAESVEQQQCFQLTASSEDAQLASSPCP